MEEQEAATLGLSRQRRHRRTVGRDDHGRLRAVPRDRPRRHHMQPVGSYRPVQPAIDNRRGLGPVRNQPPAIRPLALLRTSRYRLSNSDSPSPCSAAPRSHPRRCLHSPRFRPTAGASRATQAGALRTLTAVGRAVDGGTAIPRRTRVGHLLESPVVQLEGSAPRRTSADHMGCASIARPPRRRRACSNTTSAVRRPGGGYSATPRYTSALHRAAGRRRSGTYPRVSRRSSAPGRRQSDYARVSRRDESTRHRTSRGTSLAPFRQGSPPR